MGASKSSAARPLVLVAEDDADLRMLLATLLTERNFDVVDAADCCTAKRYMEEAALARTLRMPDIALADVRLPCCSGVELIEILAAYPVPIVAMTGVADRATYLRVRRMGALHCLQKPVSIDAVHAALVNALAASTSGRQP